MWLAHEGDKVHDGSTDNPGFAVTAPAALGTDVCTNDPCYLFRNSANIQVAANNDFLVGNPAAARLLELVQISVVDVALQNVLYDGGGEHHRRREPPRIRLDRRQPRHRRRLARRRQSSHRIHTGTRSLSASGRYVYAW